MNIAIYDLDKTITRRPTFTRFLLFYAWREQRYRLAALPLWLGALIGYRLGFYGRKPLKQFGIALFIGRQIPRDKLQHVAMQFADHVLSDDLQPGAIQSVELDRSNNRLLVLATAAPQFYAEEIGIRLGFDAIISTRHDFMPGDRVSNKINGENCYASEKLKMVQEWLAVQKLQRGDAHLRFYSDHPSDAPMLNWVDDAMLVVANPGHKLRTLAKANHWQIVDFR